mmetsp:Transcript_107397/g.190178  ORF Transcript_107397/g.190178 Transcript_107397/m.190178 type:complete len:279 (-) Transcript_107397:47-883(-)
MRLLACAFLVTASNAGFLSYELRQNKLRTQVGKTSAGAEYVPGSDGTYAQNYQDKWIAAVARHNGWDQTGGFFLDLGAFDGLKCSNTALVEKTFGWKGICVEPRPVLGAFNQRNCILVERALSDQTGKKVKFYGTPGSQIQHIGKQSINSTHDLGEVIETLNIPDLLSCVNSPQEAQGRCHGVHGHTPIPSFINFISVDVEGQGWNVLKKFPFDTVKVGAWIVEHPSAPEQDILKKHGYIDVPVQNPGVDRYYIQPQFWDDSLVQKDWRIHPPGSSGC